MYVLPLACWECGFESCWGLGCLWWVVYVVRKSPSWGSDSLLASPETPGISWILRFITSFARSVYKSLYLYRSVQSMTPSYLLQVHVIIIISYTPRSYKSFLSLSFSHQIPLCVTSAYHMWHVPWPSHCSW